jgi:glycosyltransferase involved in cell wall biosynthesis
MELPILKPLVSVVIPTLDRPHEAVGAARSALAQTLREVEVIVVVDGPGEPTLDALGQVEDPRLRVNALPDRIGPGGARNAGVTEARAEWIAFLDDDDRWEPRKLAVQLEAARRSSGRYPIISCRLIARGVGREMLCPRRLPSPDEHLSEYLLSRRGLFWGERLIHTSTLLTRKELLERVRFRVDLKKHEDWDWLLRVNTIDGVEVAFPPDPAPLAVWSTDEGRPRASTKPDWRFSLAWLRENRDLITPRAYASCLLTIVSEDAARERSPRALWLLPCEALRRGTPRPLDLLLYVGIWVLPGRLRLALARLPRFPSSG